MTLNSDPPRETGAGVDGVRRVARAVLTVAGAILASSICHPAIAAGQTEGIVGSWTIGDVTPYPMMDGPDTATCWPSLKADDILTVQSPAPNRLTVAIPSGQSWQLEPLPPELDANPSPDYASKWITTAEEVSQGKGALLEYYDDPTFLRITLRYGLNDPDGFSTAGCQVDLSAFGQSGPDVSAPSGPTMGELGVVLACQHDFADAGRAECTATPTAYADSYEWAFDGAVQPGTTGPDLVMNDVPPGEHTVSVIAHDSYTGLASQPATFSFTTLAPENGGGGVSLVPWLVAAGVVVLGGALVGSRFRPGRTRTPATAGVGPTGPPYPGATPPALPPEMLAAPPLARPAGPPERLAAPPVSQPPSVAPPAPPPVPPPRPAAPPVAVAPPMPAPPPAPPKQKRPPAQKFWIEATPNPAEVYGDGRSKLVVDVRAFRTVDGVTTNVSHEVNVTGGSVSERLIYERGQARPAPSSGAFARYTIRGYHLAVSGLARRFDGYLTVHASSVRGEVAQTSVAVAVLPASLEVKVTAEKAGFKRGTLTALVPNACGSVNGTVMTDDVAVLGYQITERPVAHARCTTSMRLDKGPWEPLRPFTTDANGSFAFVIPLGAEFGAAAHVLSRPVKLNVDDDVKAGARGQKQAITDLHDHSRKSPFINHQYDQALEPCRRYLDHFLDQLCTEQERDHDRRLGGLHTLRTGISFVRTHRLHFIDQRAMVKAAAKDEFDQLINVVTDWIPVAGWLMGEPIKIKGLEIPGFPTIVKNFLELALGPGSIAFLKKIGDTLVAFLGELAKLLSQICDSLWEVFKAHSLPGSAFDRYYRALQELCARPPADPTDDTPGAALAALVDAITNAAKFLAYWVRVMVCFLIDAFILAVAAAVKTTSVAIEALLESFGYEGMKATYAEMAEEAVSQLAGSLYDSAGAILEWLYAWRPESEKKVSRDFFDVVLDSKWSVEAMDSQCISTLRNAHAASMQLRVPDNWRECLHTSIVQERRHEEYWHSWYVEVDGSNGWVTTVEWVDFWAKMLVRAAQVVGFSAAILQQGASKALVTAARTTQQGAGTNLLRAADHMESATSNLSMIGWFEALVNIASLVGTRGLQFGVAFKEMDDIFTLSEKRVQGLYSS